MAQEEAEYVEALVSIPKRVLEALKHQPSASSRSVGGSKFQSLKGF